MKYKYWTLIKVVGEDFKNRIRVGEYISAPYKKESWEILDRKECKIKFMCSGVYICRTPENASSEEILKIIREQSSGELAK